jgi:thymidylate synthase
MEINFKYKVKYVPNLDFEFLQYDEEIGVAAYKRPLMKEMYSVVKILKRNRHARTAVAQLFSQQFQSCLLTIQFQFVEDKLYLTANYRSQAAVYRARDEEMLSFLATHVLNSLNLEVKSEVEITCNVGNYHVSRYNL